MLNYSDRFWEKHIDPNVRHVELTEITFLDLFLQSYQKYPDHTAIFFYGMEYTYAEVEALSNKMANTLIELGVKKGDHLGICMDNCPQYVVAMLAMFKVGATLVQISPLLAPPEILFILNDSNTLGVFTLDYLFPKIAGLKDQSSIGFIAVTSLYDCLPMKPFPCLPFILPENRLPIPKEDWVYDYRDMLNQKANFVPQVLDCKTDVAMLNYTSGTTGKSKGAMISHFNLSSYIRLITARDYKTEFGKDVYLVTMPMSHNFAITQTVIAPLYVGGKIVMMAKFHPDETLKLMHHCRVNVARGVPAMVSMCTHHPEVEKYDLSSLRHWTVGGSPVPEEVGQAFFRITGARVVEGYGLTESTSGIFTNEWYRDQEERGFGKVFQDHDLRVVNPETGENVPVGETGELLIKGPTISIGYYNNPEATAKTFRDGWLHTGDLVRMTERGTVQYVDRLKDLIIVSGFNVYPGEVEDVLYKHDSVMEVAVIGIPDEKRGEVVCAVVKLKPNTSTTPEELIELCTKNLAPYKVPRVIKFVDDFERTGAGKIIKRKLRETMNS